MKKLEYIMVFFYVVGVASVAIGSTVSILYQQHRDWWLTLLIGVCVIVTAPFVIKFLLKMAKMIEREKEQRKREVATSQSE